MDDQLDGIAAAAELVHEQLGQLFNFDFLSSAGTEVKLEYDPNAIRLRVGSRVVSAIELPG